MCFLFQLTNLIFPKEGPRLRAQGSPGSTYSKASGHCGAALDLGDGPD